VQGRTVVTASGAAGGSAGPSFSYVRNRCIVLHHVSLGCVGVQRGREFLEGEADSRVCAPRRQSNTVAVKIRVTDFVEGLLSCVAGEGQVCDCCFAGLASEVLSRRVIPTGLRSGSGRIRGKAAIRLRSREQPSRLQELVEHDPLQFAGEAAEFALVFGELQAFQADMKGLFGGTEAGVGRHRFAGFAGAGHFRSWAAAPRPLSALTREDSRDGILLFGGHMSMIPEGRLNEGRGIARVIGMQHLVVVWA